MSNRLATQFNNLSIGTRIVGGFMLLALASGAIGYNGILALSQSHKALEKANGNLIPSIRALTNMRGALGTVQRNERNAVIAARLKDEAARHQCLRAAGDAWDQVASCAKQYESYPMIEKEKQLWGEFRPRLDEVRRDHEAVLAALRAGNLEDAEKLCLASLPNAVAAGARLNALVDLQSEVGQQDFKAAQEQYASARSTTFAVVAGAVAAAVALGLFFRGLIAPPLRAAVHALRSVAAGDLTKTIPVSSRDEFGQLGTALNDTVTGIQTALKQEHVNWKAIGEQREQNADFVSQIAAVGKAMAVIEFELDGTIVAANENFLGALGYTMAEIQGRHHSMFAEPSLAASAEYREFWAKLNRGEFVAGEFKRIGKGGKEVWIQASYNPILDRSGRAYKVVKFAADITAAKKMEFKIKEDAVELQRKVDVIVTSADAMAKGDFTVDIPDLGSDAVGKMAQSLGRAVVSVRAVLEGVRDVSGQLADAAGQLSSASEEISTGAQQQASNLEETASTLEQITATVKQNADSVQQARQLASGSKETAERGGAVVGSAVDAMAEINASSKKIADIITTIDEIAFQTNLLALNAAVEAARAGEQGRGFAVVATEVRNLAQRSATAAKEIKGLINDSVKKVDAGTDLVNRSGDTLAEIVTSVKRVTDIVSEIAAAGKEQANGIDQVNKAVKQMDSVTQRNASQTEEMSATAQALTDQAGQLRDLVARFKLSADTGHEQVRPAPRGARKVGGRRPRPSVAKALGKGRSNGGHELDAIGGNDGFTDF
ncbi:methyl-accepting chemotaxis protein [Gemmata sp. JC673]|uniref:Methyl-accepting chemotaxis protein n=1 Tax=Gemmata algarum TaxID=2975278 RepID=A0ABU5F2D2_9BACT|nr:methyl-accepting chemotaxis protein [Gemmata algarum]MDY3561730.1 methyl-accepting chemotaxis protein [Gemmata algarum]